MTAPPSLSLPGDLEVTMLSDWHIGTGAGIPGGVDRSVIRDHDGLPYIPASSLTGVLRDTSARIAEALDNPTAGGGSSGGWRSWHHWLFGGLTDDGSRSPTRAAVAISAARLRPALRRVLCNEDLIDDVTLTRSSTAIDSTTGTASDKSLRMVELARRGTVLVATIDLTDPGSSLPTEAAFLLAAAVSTTERLGGKRTRGSGRCTLALAVEIDWQEWTHWARSHVPSTPKPVDTTASSDDDVTSHTAHGTGWEHLDLRILAVEPVAIEAERCGNVQTTHLYIPGSVLLPALHERLGPGLGTAIATGDVQVSDALPLDPNGRPARATPLGWLVPKQTGNDATITDCLLERPKAGVQLRRVSTPFITVDTKSVARPVEVLTTTDAHAVIDPATGRPTSEVGGLFVRQAIRPGTEFATTVRWRAGLLQRESVEDALKGRWRVGTARRSGYGAVDVSMADPPDAADAPPPSTGSTVIAEALSDVLVRDDRLRWDPTPSGLAGALSVAGWTFTPAGPGTGSDPDATAVSRFDGWHARWSLPRPSLGGLAAGSRVILRCDAAGQPADLLNLLQRGVGERVAEGFGRVKLSLPTPIATALSAAAHKPPDLPRLMPNHDPAAAGHLEENDAELIATIRSAALRRRVQLALHSAKLVAVSDGKPGASQLGALRSVGVTLALDPRPVARERAQNWLTGLLGTAARKSKWQQETLDQVTALLEDPGTVWGQLDVTPPDDIDGSSALTLETLGWFLAAAAKNGGAQ